MNQNTATLQTSPKGQEPMKIVKFTLGYDHIEDRLRIDGQGGGRVIRLWLTRRLGDVVFGHLANNILAQGATKDPAFGRLLNTWEQQAAQAQQRTQQRTEQPVQWQGEAVLVSTVELGRNPAGTRVTFKAALAGTEHPVAQLSLGDTHLRQWLGIVFRTYKSAGWPVDAWPEWVAQAQQVAVAEAEQAEKP